MSNFFGPIANARARVLDQETSENRANQTQLLSLALLKHRLEREESADNMKRVGMGYVPDASDPNEPASSATPQTPGPSPVSPAVKSPMPGYHFDPTQTPDARRRKGQVSERTAALRSYNASRPPAEQLDEARIGLLANNDALYDAWSKKSLGISTDPVTTYQKKRDYAVAHPLPTRASSSSQGVAERAGLNSVQRQITETLGEIHRETPKPLGILASSADSSNFNAKNALVGRLRQRADSLSSVRDKAAGDVQSRVAAKVQGYKAQLGQQSPSRVDPTAQMSDADAWEYWVNHGLSKTQATGKVNSRKAKQ